MNELTAFLPGALLRTAVALSATFLIACLLLRRLDGVSHAARRAIWILVLLQGWLFVRYPVELPWLAAAQFRPRIAGSDPLLEVSATAEFPPTGDSVGQESNRRSKREPASEDRSVKSHALSWQGIVAIAWLGGCVACLSRWLVSYWRFVRALPLGAPPSKETEGHWRQLLAERGVQRQILLRMTDGLGPMLCRVPGGYRLLVPSALWRELPHEARLTVLRHELAHYERGDVWKSLAARLLILPQWFNPFAWRAMRNFDETAEWACDDEVRRAFPDSAPAYGKALLALVVPRAPAGVLNTAAQGRGVALRIRRILAPDLPEDSRMKATCLIVTSLALLLATGLRVNLIAKEATDKPAAKAGRGGDEAHVKAAMALLTAAKKASEITTAEYDEGTVTLTDAYVWSRRLLDAERAVAKNEEDDLKALRDHWKRIEQLYRRTKALHEMGRRGGEEQKLRSLEYYLAEVELWIVDAGAEPPKRAP